MVFALSFTEIKKQVMSSEISYTGLDSSASSSAQSDRKSRYGGDYRRTADSCTDNQLFAKSVTLLTSKKTKSGAAPTYYVYEQLRHPDKVCPSRLKRERNFPISPGKENPSRRTNRWEAAHGSKVRGSKHRPRRKIKPQKLYL